MSEMPSKTPLSDDSTLSRFAITLIVSLFLVLVYGSAHAPCLLPTEAQGGTIPTLVPTPTATEVTLPTLTPTEVTASTATLVHTATPTRPYYTRTATQTPTNTSTATPTVTHLPTSTLTPSPIATLGEVEKTITLQQGTDGYTDCEDTHIHQWNPDSNYCGDNQFRVGYRQQYAGSLRFGLSSILTGAQVTSAELQLYATGWGGADLTVDVYAILRHVSMCEATWNRAASGNPWGQAGCNDPLTDRRGTAESSLTTSGVNRWYSFNVTNVVQDWSEGSLENNGLLLRGTSSTSTAEFYFASVQHETVSQRPKLVVTYRSSSDVTPTVTTTPTCTRTATSTPTSTGTATPTITLTTTATATDAATPTPTVTLTFTPTTTPTPPLTLQGDLDGDCDVDVLDIMLVASRWATSQGDTRYETRYDLDNDGDIDVVDIMAVAAHWGERCAQ